MDAIIDLASLPAELLDACDGFMQRAQSSMSPVEFDKLVKHKGRTTRRLYTAQSLTGLYTESHDVTYADMQSILDDTADMLQLSRVQLIQAEWESRTACYWDGKIWLPACYRNPFVLLHEFTHHVLREAVGNEAMHDIGHSRDFADCQLTLLEGVMAPADAMLEAGYVITQVDYTPRGPLQEALVNSLTEGA